MSFVSLHRKIDEFFLSDCYGLAPVLLATTTGTISYHPCFLLKSKNVTQS